MIGILILKIKGLLKLPNAIPGYYYISGFKVKATNFLFLNNLLGKKEKAKPKLLIKFGRQLRTNQYVACICVSIKTDAKLYVTESCFGGRPGISGTKRFNQLCASAIEKFPVNFKTFNDLDESN